jgi:hypothetical protein
MNDEQELRRHQLAGVRGCLFGLTIAAVFWLVVAVVVWLVLWR